jgi:hypothetical protein
MDRAENHENGECPWLVVDHVYSGEMYAAETVPLRVSFYSHQLGRRARRKGADRRRRTWL